MSVKSTELFGGQRPIAGEFLDIIRHLLHETRDRLGHRGEVSAFFQRHLVDIDRPVHFDLQRMIPASRIHYPIIFARLLGAIVFGGLIGFEREARDRPAGFRTHILISLAAALFAIISIEAVHMASAKPMNSAVKPLRAESPKAEETVTKASTISAKYSRGPKTSASLTI